jgi:hypothetical protein
MSAKIEGEKVAVAGTAGAATGAATYGVIGGLGSGFAGGLAVTLFPMMAVGAIIAIIGYLMSTATDTRNADSVDKPKHSDRSWSDDWLIL